MSTIYLFQLRDDFGSLRVQLSLGLVVLFFALNGGIATSRVTQLREDDRVLRDGVEAAFDAVRTVGNATGIWFRTVNEPTGTEFMTEGGFDWFWGMTRLSAQTGRYVVFSHGRGVNVWMDSFQNLDWTLVVRLVLSFLCIVLGYDSIAGESARGTLRLVLSCPIARIRVLVAKFTAHLTVLATAYVCGSLVSLTILGVSGTIALDSTLLAGYALYSLAVVCYLSLFLFLALGVSALARTAVSALVFLTLSWAVFVVVLPQTSYLVAVHAVDVPARWAVEPWDYGRQARSALEADGLSPRSRDGGAVDGYLVEQRYARLLGEAEDEQFRIGRHSLDLLVERYELARAINLLSPAYAFQYTVEALLGTGLAKRQNFIAQSFDYRESLRSFLRQADASDPDSPHVLFLPEYMSSHSLHGADVPHFSERQVSPAQGLTFSVVPLVVFLLEVGTVFLFALWAMNRADLTGYAAMEE